MTTPAAAAQITAYVPAARWNQVVTIDGTDYRVSEINLAAPDYPVLTPVA